MAQFTEPEMEAGGPAPTPGIDAWKALLEKEGVVYDKLVGDVLPLYVDGPALPLRPGTGRFAVCMRVGDRPSLDEDIAGGADMLWLDARDDAALEAGRAAGLPLICEVGDVSPRAALEWFQPRAGDQLAIDPITAILRGAPPATLSARLGVLPSLEGAMVRASTLAFHEAGADAADEIALSLATGTMYLRSLEGTAITVQTTAGRDTFGELCKLRALRLCWTKLFTAAGVDARPPIHAVCAERTQAQRDPWVNMLRVTTEVFAAALGGADIVTPLPFDASPHARRVARNTALVLREESHLGRVVDPAGGSYYLETRTDQLAREAWKRFQQIEKEGGIAAMIVDGRLQARLEASWQQRAAQLAKRKLPVLGVSEFANLDEQDATPYPARGHRDAEAFEALRDASEDAPREVVLIALGPAKEHRARVGFAQSFFACAGLRAREIMANEKLDGVPHVACICGSDERYAAEAVAVASELRAAGARHVVLAGKPGELELPLRQAGADAFIYMGCDVVATLTELLK